MREVEMCEYKEIEELDGLRSSNSRILFRKMWSLKDDLKQ